MFRMYTRMCVCMCDIIITSIINSPSSSTVVVVNIACKYYNLLYFKTY